jgi:hypothetical protein
MSKHFWIGLIAIAIAAGSLAGFITWAVHAGGVGL